MTVTQNWDVTKPSARGGSGVVVTQSESASRAGSEILSAGGNAADAAVAAAFVLATVEPWNSGLGGVGYGLIKPPGEKAQSLDFGPTAPRAADPGHYPLTGGVSDDIFGWPKVRNDCNVHGPLSFCTPSAVAGYGELHRKFGRLPWREVLEPAVSLSRRGMVKDWFSTVKIAQMAHYIQLYDESARIYLPGNLPPVGREKGNPEFLHQGRLEDTLSQLQKAGPQDFYVGEIAREIVADCRELGAILDSQDLEDVLVDWEDSDTFIWESGTISLPPRNSAGPMLRRALDEIAGLGISMQPDAEWFRNLSLALRSSFRNRQNGAELAGQPSRETCTTHLNVVDPDGMAVAVTTTLLGLMGSAVVLPQTGVLMNNGMMWFDPRSGRPNSVGQNNRPLSNMLPVIFERGEEMIVAGASGGRRILSSVAQVLAYVIQFSMSPEDAAHFPRIDVSDADTTTIDRRMAKEIIETLKECSGITLSEHATAPLNFGCPSFIFHSNSQSIGMPDVMTPWSAAIAPSVDHKSDRKTT